MKVDYDSGGRSLLFEFGESEDYDRVKELSGGEGLVWVLADRAVSIHRLTGDYSPVGLIRKSVFEESENLIQQWSGGTSATSIRAREMRLAISAFCSSERPSYQWTSTNGMGGRRRRR
jgi:hypothetical protein